MAVRVTPVKGVHQGGVSDADAAHGAVHPTIVALPRIQPSQEDGNGGQGRRTVTEASSVDGAFGGYQRW
jgi:hypothetical protein